MTNGGMGRQDHLLGGRYHILRELGRGGFGCTYLAEDINRFNELCVLKEFFPQVNDNTTLQKAKQLFEREAGILYQLNHPQIPKFRELLRVQTNDHGRLFLVQDYVEGPTYQELLETRLQSGNHFTEPEIIQLLQQVLPVLDYLHRIGVIHRDIAPDNLIQRNTDGLPVLIDFGGVKKLVTVVQQQVGTSAVPTRLGKVGYAPEEQLDAGHVTPSADLYALAVTALVLLTGESPQTLYDSYSKQWQWQQWVTLSPRLTHILQRMLAPNLGDRYSSATAVIQALSALHSQGAAPMSASRSQVEPTRAVAPGSQYRPTVAPPPSNPSASRTAVTYTNSAQAKAKRTKTLNGCLQAFVGLMFLLGVIGLVWWIASRWEPGTVLPNASETADPPAPDEPSPASTLSPEEQARKQALQRRQQNLGVDNQFLVSVSDQLFYQQFPDIQGQPLSDRPEDAAMRAEWNTIANEVLDTLEANLSAAARQQLGSYTAGTRDQWRQQINQRFVSSRALNDLADAKFTYLYPQNAAQDFIGQPIGQIWHGIASDRVQALVSGERLTEIQFEQGRFSQSLRDRLKPGEGRVYILNLREGQLMRLNLQATAGSTRLSIYVPSPNDQTPYLLEDSVDQTWSGQLPQSGYYEVVVVSTEATALGYTLTVAVDNVTSNPNQSETTPTNNN